MIDLFQNGFRLAYKIYKNEDSSLTQYLTYQMRHAILSLVVDIR